MAHSKGKVRSTFGRLLPKGRKNSEKWKIGYRDEKTGWHREDAGLFLWITVLLIIFLRWTLPADDLHPQRTDGQILDIDTDDIRPISDSDVKAFLLKSKGIANPLIIQSLEKTRRNEMLISAFSFGAGIRQLSRLTGVSFGVIQKL